MSGIMNVDASKAVVPDDFNTIEEAVVVADGQGIGRWTLQKLGISLDGSIRAASSLSASNLQTNLGMLVTAGDADNPPDFFQITAAAFGEGGSPGEIEERAKRDMCAQVAEYLWRCSGRGKMKVAEGYLIFPSISFSASGVADVAATAEGYREHDDDVQSVASASPAGSTVPKRTQGDMQSLISELDGMAERGEGDGSNLGVSAGSAKKKAKPTYVTHRDKVSRMLDPSLTSLDGPLTIIVLFPRPVFRCTHVHGVHYIFLLGTQNCSNALNLDRAGVKSAPRAASRLEA